MKNVNLVTLNVKLVMFMINVVYVQLTDKLILNLTVHAQLVLMKINKLSNVYLVISDVILVITLDIVTVLILDYKTKIVNVQKNGSKLINTKNVIHVTKNVELVLVIVFHVLTIV
jgi:hypothetical protein